MGDNDLGYFRDYGNIIFSLSIMVYMILYTYLCGEHGPIDE